jgi:hypothetical protein
MTTTTTTPRLVPGVFGDRSSAEAAIEELRNLGLTDDDLGVAVPEPGRYVIEQHAEEEAVKGLAEGAAFGAPIGAIAGLGLMAVALGAAGLTVGLGGLLVGVGGGAGWGSILGGAAGFSARVRLDDLEDRYCEIPLGGEDVLVVARAGDRIAKVREIMQAHGAKCFLDEAHTSD